eukprot:364531-Chlamydomonas_euryale.AAC.11
MLIVISHVQRVTRACCATMFSIVAASPVPMPASQQHDLRPLVLQKPTLDLPTAVLRWLHSLAGPTPTMPGVLASAAVTCVENEDCGAGLSLRDVLPNES